jgi:hypothetical protein
VEIWPHRNFGAGTHHPDYALADRKSVVKMLRKNEYPSPMCADTHSISAYRAISIKPTLEMTFYISDL